MILFAEQNSLRIYFFFNHAKADGEKNAKERKMLLLYTDRN